MSVYYKFNAATGYDTLAIDGLYISLSDLKAAIIHQKRLGKGDVCDLLIKNAETQECYNDDKALIQRNSSLIIARIPVDPSKKKFGDPSKEDKELLLSNPDYRMNTEGSEEAERMLRRIEEVPDLTKFNATEDEKISAMMAQSTINYHPSRYLKLRNTIMTGKVPATYKCYKCHQGGHWVSNCPLNNTDLKKSTGIPSKFLMDVTDPDTPGAMITPTGKYVVFVQEAVKDVQSKVQPTYIPPTDDLICPICKDMMKDAVIMPCCTEAYCDDCIKTHLLDSEDQKCPACDVPGTNPMMLIPYRHLRRKAKQFGLQYLTVGDELRNGDPPKSSSGFSVRATESIPKPDSSPSMPESTQKSKSPEPEPLQPTDQEVLNIISTTTTEVKETVSAHDTDDKSDEDEEEDSQLHQSKKKKKEKKPKKDKKDKKDKKEKKKDKKEKKDKKLKKLEHDENLMNEAVCPTFDPSVPPPNLSLPASTQGAQTNLYDDISRQSQVNLYPSPYGGVVDDDPLAKFEAFIRKKDALKKQQHLPRSPRSPRYRTRSRTPPRSNMASVFSHLPSRDTTSPRLSRSPNVDRKRRYTPASSPRRSYRSPSMSRSTSPQRFHQIPPLTTAHHGFPMNENVTQPSADYPYQADPFYGQQRYTGYGWEQQQNMYPNGQYRSNVPFRGQEPSQSYGSSDNRSYGQSQAWNSDRSHREYDSRRRDERRHDSRDYSRSRRDSPSRKKSLSQDRYRESSSDRHHRRRRDSPSRRDRRHDRRQVSPERKPRDTRSKSRGRDRKRERDDSRPLYKDSKRKRDSPDTAPSSSPLDKNASQRSSPKKPVEIPEVKPTKPEEPHPKRPLEDPESDYKQATKIARKSPSPVKSSQESEKEKRKHDKKKKKDKKAKRRLSENSVEAPISKKKKKKKDKNKERDEPAKNRQDSASPRPQVDAYVPALSRWERDEFEHGSPLKGNDALKKSESLVTSDVLKRAEHALFSRGLGSSKHVPSKRDSPSSNPESRDAQKKGASIQITISSKTESQIGRPKPSKGSSS